VNGEEEITLFFWVQKGWIFIFSFSMSVSSSRYKYPAQTLGREVENFPQFVMFDAPCFAISLHWGGGSVSWGLGVAGRASDKMKETFTAQVGNSAFFLFHTLEMEKDIFSHIWALKHSFNIRFAVRPFLETISFQIQMVYLQ